jgi:two-component system OmpR family response regulator
MSAVRVLHVDDEPDIREVVELSLGLDPEFTVKSCSSGGDALVAAADWSPDLILLDVMMPEMDGPTTLARLRENPSTNEIPVVFMTARAQPRELKQFRDLGAAGVISKPFDPLTLAATVRDCVQRPDDRFAAPRARFINRARDDIETLAHNRAKLGDEAKASGALNEIITVAHRLAGGGGTVGLPEISANAFALEQCALGMLSGSDTKSNVEATMEKLVDVIGQT